ncbi:MAG TPA: aminotransferase class I/II-fold pyridoxal phosphate-dependent enzyme, partial [Polyangiaceae bacterium]|nr:aminotransferase class I/II-fold pyridoxal phosphate-dependent enzyme [Polyangiaceae bacterium]
MIAARPNVEALERYVAPLEGRRGMLRLDFNENTLGPSPRVIEAIRNLPPEAYATYPEYAGLVEAYAGRIGVAPDELALFNGADAGIRAIFDAFGDPGGRFVTLRPTFGYYTPCAQIAGMEVCTIPYAADLSFPWAALRAELSARARICFICNPNNPTSTLVPAEQILELAEAHPNTLFVIDEIYEPFTRESVLPRATQRGNVL